MEKKEKKNKHSINHTNTFLIILTIIFLIFSVITLCFYATRLGNMKFKDFFHFWDYISSKNSDWDTFSFLLSGAIGCSFSGITLLFVIVQYYNGLKEKKEAEIEKVREEQKHFFEKNKIEQEKRREKYENQREQEKIEKDKLTVRYIEDMEKLNKRLFSNYNSYIYESLNKEIEKSIYFWLLIESFEKANFSNFQTYQVLKKSFPATTDPFDTPLEWDDFIKNRDPNTIYNLLSEKLHLSDDIKHEILENVGDYFSIEKSRIINQDIVRQIIFNRNDPLLRDILKMIIEHFLYAMRSLDGYKEGIDYYFLQLSAEQRFFFAFIAKDEWIIRIVKEAIDQTNLLDDRNNYLILKLINKIN